MTIFMNLHVKTERQKNFNGSQGQEQEIKDHFYKEAENYAYWYFKDEDKME